MSDKFSDMDSFWDIEKLVPKKKTTLSPFTSQISHKEYKAEPKREETTPQRSDEERKLTQLQGVRNSEESTYTPRSNSLIKSVTIKRFVDKYDFYDSFRKAALIYFEYKTDKCSFVPFYSYMPQYSQLNTEQKNYYFYWRSEVRRKKYPRSDYSYIYLYVYEILNLHDKIPATEGIKLLCEIWREYRGALPRLDSYFSIWVQDYCLVYGLDCPMDYIRDFLFDALCVSSFKEFYLSDINIAGEAGVGPMLAYLCDYDWRRCKVATGENSELYKKHMKGAMHRVLSFVWNSNTPEQMKPKVLSRDAFPNSLCTHSVKCKLMIEYYSISEADEVRRSVTAAVRYTENKLRAFFGVKSRLAVKDLPDLYRSVIDKYFNRLYEEENRVKAIREAPEYEKLYDAPSAALSFADADEIELASWATTARLVTEDGDVPDTVSEAQRFKAVREVPVRSKAHTVQGEDNRSELYGLSDEEIAFVGYCLGEISKDADFAYREDELAEKINECFSDNFGDIILENNGDGYTVICDYREDVKEWFSKIMK